MILSCNSCEKKFVVPDQAITSNGRTVQCGSCGNKWKQFPVKKQANKTASYKKNNTKKVVNLPRTATPKSKRTKKKRGIDLYSPEYLAKKHGIVLNDIEVKRNHKSNERVSFGFYNSLILFIIFFIALSKSLHFFKILLCKKYHQVNFT